MHIVTYNALMQYCDQMIRFEHGHIVILADNKETVDTVVTICRSAGLRVKKLIIDKGAPDAEMHLRIT